MDKGIIIYFRKKFPIHKDYFKRLAIQLAVIVIATFLVIYILSFFIRLAPPGYLGTNPTNIEIIFGTFTITAIVTTIYEAMYFFDLWKVELLKNEQLKTANTKAQLDVLKNQVNPHFLFNSFNTLVAIIPDEPEIAIQFTNELSNFYRYILTFTNKELIPLEHELECIDSFIYLLKIRFQDNLVFDKQIDQHDPNLFIVPLSLQILVENAIKHNIISQSKPLVISMFIKNNHICVANNYQLKKQISSTQTGLKNIQKRYELLVNKEIQVHADNQLFQVCLPLIDAQIL